MSSAFFILKGLGWLLGHGLLPASAHTSDAACFSAAINAARAKAGVGALVANEALAAIARTHSATMEAAGTIFHNRSLPQDAPAGWLTVGENVGMGPSCD